MTDKIINLSFIGVVPNGKPMKMYPLKRKCLYQIQVSSTNPASIPYKILGYDGTFIHVMKQVPSSCCLSPSPVNTIPVCRQNAFVTASQWNARLRPGEDDVPGDDRTLPLHLWLKSTPSWLLLTLPPPLNPQRPS